MSTTRDGFARHHFRPLYSLPKASFLYPLKGFWFFLRHPYLYPTLKGRLLPCFLLSIFVLFNLFFWTYLPQVAFLAIFHWAGAWFNGTILVLGEGAAIVALLFEAFFVDESQVDIFDSVLVARGHGDLVSTHRAVADNDESPLQRLGRPTRTSVYAPFSLRQIVEFIIFLPLNFIPVVGVPLFLVLTGYRGGPFHHWRYFKLLDFDRKQRSTYIRKKRWSYTWFGTVALALQLVPVLSMLFLMTTAAGAALWVADLEDEKRMRDDMANPQAGYTDDPVS